MEPNDIKKEYELSFLVKSEEDAADVMSRVKQHGGEVTLEGAMKRIALAYPIKKEEHAIFGYVHATFSPASIPPLEQDLQVSSPALRFLIVTPPYMKEQRVAPTERKPMAPGADVASRPMAEKRPSMPLSNEALEKKIEEILQ